MQRNVMYISTYITTITHKYYKIITLFFTGERLGGCDEGSDDGSVVLRRRDRLVPEPGNRDSNSTIICEI